MDIVEHVGKGLPLIVLVICISAMYYIARYMERLGHPHLAIESTDSMISVLLSVEFISLFL